MSRVRHPVKLALFVLAIPIALALALALPSGGATTLLIVAVVAAMMLPYLHERTIDRGDEWL